MIVIEQVIEFFIGNSFQICGIVLAIGVFSFSLFATIYSTTLQNARMADVSSYSYALQGEIEENSINDTTAQTEKERIYKTRKAYEKIAREWLLMSKEYRGQAEKRAYAAYFSLLSLFTIILSLIFPFILSLLPGLKHQQYLVTVFILIVLPSIISLKLSVIFLIVAVAIYVLDLKTTSLKGLPRIPFISPQIQRPANIDAMIQKHDYLKNVLQ